VTFISYDKFRLIFGVINLDLKNLILKKTPAGLRWYDTSKGRYVKVKNRKYQMPEGMVSYHKGEEYFKIEVDKENKLITYEGENGNLQETKTIREFEDKDSVTSFYRGLIKDKNREGFRNWNWSIKEDVEEKSKIKGVFGSRLISKKIKFHRKSKKKEVGKEKKLEKTEVPDGYVEIDKDLSEKFEKISCHLAEFMKQSKRTKAIRDIRNNVKNIGLYKSIQYKVNFALDQFEGTGIDQAKWALKKNNRISRLAMTSNDGMVMIKATNLKIFLESIVIMIKVLRGLLIYYDPRSPEEVKRMGRKGGGKILLRPKRVTVQRFFREGADLFQESVGTIEELRTYYPVIAQRVM
jgi:hypothetical protein